jgi:hypothetical protein
MRTASVDAGSKLYRLARKRIEPCPSHCASLDRAAWRRAKIDPSRLLRRTKNGRAAIFASVSRLAANFHRRLKLLER